MLVSALLNVALPLARIRSFSDCHRNGMTSAARVFAIIDAVFQKPPALDLPCKREGQTPDPGAARRGEPSAKVKVPHVESVARHRHPGQAKQRLSPPAPDRGSLPVRPRSCSSCRTFVRRRRPTRQRANTRSAGSDPSVAMKEAINPALASVVRRAARWGSISSMPTI